MTRSTHFYSLGRHGPVVSESADVQYMVSRVEYCVAIVLLTQHIVYQLCWWVVACSDQSCFFMQLGVREESMLNEVEQSLARMGRLERLVLGTNVSLRWHSMNYQCLGARS